MIEILEQIKIAVSQRQKDKVIPLTQAAIDRGLDPEAIIKEGFVPAMDQVGEQFGAGEIFIPEMLASAMLMKQALELVKPLVKSDETKTLGKVLISTVKGDLHDIGKNIVVMMLEGAGFTVIDAGVDQSAENIAAMVRDEKPQILGLSALLTTTVPEIPIVLEELERQDLRRRVKVVVGGAPLDAAFAESIGADGYGRDAAEAVTIVKRLI